MVAIIVLKIIKGCWGKAKGVVDSLMGVLCPFIKNATKLKLHRNCSDL